MNTILVMGLGLAAGSFANAAVWRLHLQVQAREKSKVKSLKPKNAYGILAGRSMCPNCHHQLAAKDLIPVLSWLMLRGNCRYCRKSISVQYPIVELLTALVFTWFYLGWDFSTLVNQISFGFWLVFITGLIIIAVYDLRWMIIPNRVLGVLVVLAAMYIVTRALLEANGWLALSAIAAGALWGGFFYTLFAVSRGRWMGGGDVKLVFLLGLLLGFQASLVGMFIGFMAAALVSIGLMAARRLSRKDLIPFGPFLIAGALVAAVHTQLLVDWYLNFFLPY